MSQDTASATRERPILFSGPMVRAILGGEKTQTRRVVTRGTSEVGTGLPWSELDWSRVFVDDGYETWHYLHVGGPDDTYHRVRCRVGQPGDLLWVRETFAIAPAPEESPWEDERDSVLYRSDPMYDGCGRGDFAWRWSSPIHMPRWASRLTLEITDVRVERLQDISEDDAKAEGAPAPSDFREPLPFYDGRDFREAASHRDVFRCLWNAINGARGNIWSVNPWVWVLSFRRVDPVPSTSRGL